ncbi:hypothetical protein B7P43_G02857 [Cryptotermes secundus]|uniref:Uncharacterized protein n=1 Tax=Cryptotermes secundus TaxID=105785 RepID=A0A2J7RIM4_9NEOP|nr:hypothetical protein B7P43_G02857 [Cryptotermes secundus]
MRRSRVSVLSIATGYGLDDRGVGVPVPVGSRLSPWVKRPGREADHLTPASAQIKKMWTYTSTLPHAFMA